MNEPASQRVGRTTGDERLPTSVSGGIPQSSSLIQSPVALRLLAVVILAVLLALLRASGLAFWEGFAVNLGIFMILVLSLNLASGFTGVFSLGHIGFMALGAYASAILTLPLREKGDYLPNLPGWLA